MPAGAAPLRRLAGITSGSILFLALGGTASGSDDWQRYENASFIAYSNASRRDALEIITELEYVRAAAVQTPQFFIPDDRAKTTVLLPATTEEFSRLAPYETMAGFAQPLDGGAAIVLSASSRNADARVVARHEFAHTMLFNDWFRYPAWYSEGFSEIVSSISVDRRRNRYTIGLKPDRYKGRIRPRLDWNQLVDRDFDAHALPDPRMIQSAYAQNWLLMHYLTLNDEQDFSSELDRYFGLITSGTRSQDAFTEAFGARPSDLWETALRNYDRRPPTVRRDFDPSILDLDFAISDLDNNDLDPLLIYLADKAAARRPGRTGLDSLDRLPGIWDQLKNAGQCSEPLVLNLRAGTNIIAIEGFYSLPGAPSVPGLFEYERIADDAFRLVNVTDREFPNVVLTNDYRLSMRNENVLCLDEMPLRQICGAILHRCDRGSVD